MNWLRKNADRTVLAAAGIGLVVLATWPLRTREPLAVTIAVLGVALFILGVTLRRVDSFSVGLKGIKAELSRIEPRLRHIEQRVNAIVSPPTVEAKVMVFTPTIKIGPPETQ